MAYRKNNNYGNAPHTWNAPQNFQQNFNNGGTISTGKKRSGAKMGIQSKGRNEGKIYVSAWKANKQHGLVKISAFENARSTRSESQSGNKFVTMMFEIFYQNSGSKVLEIAPFNLTSGKVFLEKLGWVVSTKARNGGFTGKIK